KVHTFRNFTSADYHLNGSSRHYYQGPFTDKQYIRDWRIGLPLTVTAYDHNNRVLNQVINTYSFAEDYSSTQGKIENTKTLKISYPTWADGDPFYTVYTDSY